MAVFIVTYDLNSPGQSYSKLIAAIERYTHIKCLKSAFFVDYLGDAPTVRDDLMRYTDTNDQLYVMEINQNWGAKRADAATAWLKAATRTWGRTR